MLADPSVPGTVDCWPQKAICDSTILCLGDSGSLIYNPNMKTKYSVDEFLKGATDGKWTTYCQIPVAQPNWRHRMWRWLG